MSVAFGLDRVVAEPPPLLLEGPVGVVTNRAATTATLEDAVIALARIGVQWAAIFAPEHGFSTALPAGHQVASAVESRTRVPLYSLYGEAWAPPPEILADLTALVVDLPDVGARMYTYVSTVIHVLRAAARAGVPVLLLDRPNPINGVQVEGPILEDAYTSFVGMLPVPVRHGLTLGELAHVANNVLDIGAQLHVIPVSGWQRSMGFDAWGRPWVPPSPNIPHGETALLYPGMSLIEGTNLSEGRGTPYPFAVVGAPWLDPDALARRLNAYPLPGVRFRPVSFTPCADKHRGHLCHGVQVHITDPRAFRPVRTGIAVLLEARAQDPDAFAFLPPRRAGETTHFDRLIGNGHVRAQVEAGARWEEIVGPWEREERAFLTWRQPYLLYP
ncbi:MAG: DUF1343 domain-containing protein [Chloroflexi bacterium]|nr:DUF1343 domain-containing protein [Chloroflexota bacterium]